MPRQTIAFMTRRSPVEVSPSRVGGIPFRFSLAEDARRVQRIWAHPWNNCLRDSNLTPRLRSLRVPVICRKGKG